MVKSEIITRIVNKFRQLPEKDVELGINQILECMCETMQNDGRIEIRGFGSFSLHHREARNARNPKTGEKVVTTHKHIPHFKPGKLLKEAVENARRLGTAITEDDDSEII